LQGAHLACAACENRHAAKFATFLLIAILQPLDPLPETPAYDVEDGIRMHAYIFARSQPAVISTSPTSAAYPVILPALIACTPFISILVYCNT